MVHRRGQFGLSGYGRPLLLAAFLTLMAEPGFTQGIGFQGGFTIDPEQVYVGTHLEAGPLLDRLYFRPNIEGGFGEGPSLAAINLEFIYRVDLPGSAWAFYQGSGPAINLYSVAGEVDARAGFNFVLGFGHSSGFFTEVKVGTANSPNLKVGSGYTIR